MIKAPLYIRKKTGKKYLRLASGYDKTHDCECVIYCPDNEENVIYVRSMEDWLEKFEEVRE